MWDFSDLENYKEAIDNCDFEFCNNISDINNTVEQWTNKIYNLALNHIPNKLVTVRNNDKLWYCNELRKLLRKKKRLHKIAKDSNTVNNWNRFKTIRNIYNNECKKRKINYESKTLSDLATTHVVNPRKWWSKLKNIVGFNLDNEIPPILCNDNVLYDDLSKVNVFYDYFSNICRMTEFRFT